LYFIYIYRCLSFSRLIINYCIFFQYVKELIYLTVISQNFSFT